MSKLNLKNSIGTMISLTSKTMERVAEQRIKNKIGLTSSQWKVILALDLFEGLSQKDLAEKIHVDSSTLVPIIDRMEKTGLIERMPDAKDRRQNRLYLTKKSESVVGAITSIILQLRKEIYRGISKNELEEIRPVLQRIIENADKILAKS